MIEKLAEAARDPTNHGYSQAPGHHEPAPRGGRQVSEEVRRAARSARREVIVCLGSKEGFSHMCLALVGPGRHGDRAGPVLSGPRLCRGAGGGQCDSRWKWPTARSSCRTSPTRASTLIPSRSCWSSTIRTIRRRVTVEPEFFVDVVKLARRYGFMVISDFAYADVAFDGYQPPSFLAAPGRHRRGRRVHHHEQGLQHGRLAGRLLLRATPRWSGPWRTIKAYYDYGMFSADPDRRDHGPAAHRRGGRSPEQPSISAAATCCATGCERIGWEVDAAAGRHVRLGQDPRAVGAADGHDRRSP